MCVEKNLRGVVSCILMKNGDVEQVAFYKRKQPTPAAQQWPKKKIFRELARLTKWMKNMANCGSSERGEFFKVLRLSK